jgi:hypothetical protein
MALYRASRGRLVGNWRSRPDWIGPYRMQSLLGRSCWDADVLRDLVRREVMASPGDRSGVLVVDETGFLKKGRIRWAGPAMHGIGTETRLVPEEHLATFRLARRAMAG